jgi:hypothetical protein
MLQYTAAIRIQENDKADSTKDKGNKNLEAMIVMLSTL